MGEVTAISWCHHTWNPWIGCQKVAPACDGCFAENLMALRYGRVEWGPHGKLIRTSEHTWNGPLHWECKAAAADVHEFVFCLSLGDFFDKKVPPPWRREACDVMRATPHQLYLILTKRPQNIIAMCEKAGGLPPNAALGTTTEDQTRLDLNVPHLIAAKKALNPLFIFISGEPLLSGLDIYEYTLGLSAGQPAECVCGHGHGFNRCPNYGRIAQRCHRCACSEFRRAPDSLYHGIDWVLGGGETDQGKHKARPTHPFWFESLEQQCARAGVPYHHKQNGEWLPLRENGDGYWPTDERGFIRLRPDGTRGPDGWPMQKVGRRHAGRLLRGKTYDGFPQLEGARFRLAAQRSAA